MKKTLGIIVSAAFALTLLPAATGNAAEAQTGQIDMQSLIKQITGCESACNGDDCAATEDKSSALPAIIEQITGCKPACNGDDCAATEDKSSALPAIIEQITGCKPACNGNDCAAAEDKSTALPAVIEQITGCKPACNGNDCAATEDKSSALPAIIEQITGGETACNGNDCAATEDKSTALPAIIEQITGGETACNGDDCAATEDKSTEKPAATAADDIKQLTAKVLELVNQTRAEVGSGALKQSDTLDAMASIRAKETTVLFSHDRPNGSSGFTVMGEFGVTAQNYGENIAYGYNSPEKVMQAWINSSGHYQNMINPKYDHIGIGLYIQNGVYYWTQFFVGNASIPDYNPPEVDGDVDGNGYREAIDYSFLSGYILGETGFNDEQLQRSKLWSGSMGAADGCILKRLLLASK